MSDPSNVFSVQKVLKPVQVSSSMKDHKQIFVRSIVSSGLETFKNQKGLKRHVESTHEGLKHLI